MLPNYLSQGEPARLFPVLSDTSKEGRTTSIVLSCFTIVRQLGAAMLGTLGQRIGTRAILSAYTEVVFKNPKTETKDRPDGLIVVKIGPREWKALVEAKIGNQKLDCDQVERYRAIAKEQNVDCLITISNQFTADPMLHPVEEIRKSRSKIPVYHWSWMNIFTQADLLSRNGSVTDGEQAVILEELIRFLGHESAGVKGFDQMPKAWASINKMVSLGSAIPARSEEASEVVDAWHQETRDLSLILSRMTKTHVTEGLSRKVANNPVERKKLDIEQLRTEHVLSSQLIISDAAAPLGISADLKRRTIEVSMFLKAPENKKTTKARLNWLLRQIKSDEIEDLHIRLLWLGKTEPNSETVQNLRENPDLGSQGKEHLTTRGFEVFVSKRLGPRFTQSTNFIKDLESLVPDFYGKVGSKLTAWRKPPPSLQPGRMSSDDVRADAIAEDIDAPNS